MIVQGLENRFVVSVSAGYCHTCAAVNDGTAYCWGYVFTEPPSGRSSGSSRPVPIDGFASAASISTSWYHRCVVTQEGAVQCAGDNQSGQLGNASTAPTWDVVTVQGISKAIAVSVGETHTCAMVENNTVLCWGENDFGQLGSGTFENSPVPTVVSRFDAAQFD